MPFAPAAKVRVADQSSEYRRHKGIVSSAVGDNHQVRLDGHGCGQTVLLRTDQLKDDITVHPTNYSNC